MLLYLKVCGRSYILISSTISTSLLAGKYCNSVLYMYVSRFCLLSLTMFIYVCSDSIDVACEKYKFQKISLLRSFCQRVGIQLVLREYHFDSRQRQPFYEDDVINMYPIVKHVAPKVCLKYSLLTEYCFSFHMKLSVK